MQALGRYFSSDGAAYSFKLPQVRERLPVTSDSYFAATERLRYRSAAARVLTIVACLATLGAIYWQIAHGDWSYALFLWLLPALFFGFALSTAAFLSVVTPFRRRLFDHIEHDLNWQHRGLRAAVAFTAPTLIRTIFMLLIMIYPIDNSVAEHSRRAALATHGVPVVAHVTTVNRQYRQCSTSYEYQWNSRSYNGSVAGCWSREIGRPINIWINSADPADQMAQDEDIWPPVFWVLVIFSVLATVLTAISLVMTARAYVPTRVKASGRPASRG